MRVIMVSGDFPPQISGVGDYAWHISKTVTEMGVEVSVVTTKNSEAEKSSRENGIDVHRIIGKWKFTEVKKIFRVLRGSHKKSVVNIQYYCPFTYGRQLMINFLPALIRLYFPRVKVVVTIHGFWEQSVFYRFRTIPMLRLAHGVIYVDTLGRKSIQKFSGLTNSRLKYIPIAGNILPVPCTRKERDMWRSELGMTDRDVVVAFFGGIGRNKGFEYLVEAVKKVNEKNEVSVVLLAIGGFHSYDKNKPYKKEILDLVSQMGMTDAVFIIESPDSERVSQYLHAADMAVYPFLDGVGENSGSMLAALSHGLPTIITEGPANNESFADRFGVCMVPAQNSSKLADAINNLALFPEQRKALKMKTLERNKNLNWRFVTEETIHFFDLLQ